MRDKPRKRRNLGTSALRAGNRPEALEAFTRSGELAVKLGHTFEVARHQEGLGLLALERQSGDEARAHLTAAAEHYEAAGAPDAERVRHLIDTL